MKNIKFFAVAAAAATIFSACSENTVTPTPQQETTISVSLALSGSSNTRNVEPAATINSIADLTNGYIFILDGDNIIYREPLTNAALDLNSVLNSSGVETGKVTEQIVGDGLGVGGEPRLFPVTSKVYVLANYPTEIGDLTDFDTLTELKAAQTTIDYGTDVNTVYTVPAMANVGGEAAILKVKDTTDTPPQAEAIINIAPLYSRVEVGGTMLDGTTRGGLTGGELVIAFDLVGVYMDNYYHTFNMGGALVPASLQDNGQDVTIGSKVASGWFGDYFQAIAWDGVNPVSPSGNVWAYHIAGGNIPRIIFEITDLEGYEDVNGNGKKEVEDSALGDFSDLHFITVKSFVDNASGKPITSFERGKIYKIRKLVFNPNDVTERPNEKDVQITAVVNVVDWQFVEAQPIL